MKKRLLFASGALLLAVVIVVVIIKFSKDPAIGKPIDSFNGVIVYYNGPVGNVSGRNTTPDGYNLGQKYQCVEFAKRYYYEYYHHKMPDAYGHAKDFFENELEDGAFNAKRALVQYRNPSRSQPKVGDLLVLGPRAGSRYGHVAIISNVEEGKIEIVQQNPGMTANSRKEFPVKHEDGMWLVDNDRILGWLRKEQQ